MLQGGGRTPNFGRPIVSCRRKQRKETIVSRLTTIKKSEVHENKQFNFTILCG